MCNVVAVNFEDGIIVALVHSIYAPLERVRWTDYRIAQVIIRVTAL